MLKHKGYDILKPDIVMWINISLSDQASVTINVYIPDLLRSIHYVSRENVRHTILYTGLGNHKHFYFLIFHIIGYTI